MHAYLKFIRVSAALHGPHLERTDHGPGWRLVCYGGGLVGFKTRPVVASREKDDPFPWPPYIPKAVVEGLQWKEVVARWGTGRTWYRARLFCDAPTGDTQHFVCYEDEPSCFLNCPKEMFADDLNKAGTRMENNEVESDDWVMIDANGKLTEAGQKLVNILTEAVHAKKTLAQQLTIEPAIATVADDDATTVTDNTTAVTEDNSSDEVVSFD